jgi:hypothetical protein
MLQLSREGIERAYWNRKIPVDAKVTKLDLLFRIPVYVGPRFVAKYKAFLRRHKAISHPPEPYFNNDNFLPEIEVTIDCDKKDLPLILDVVSCAERNIKNPIAKIDIVVPAGIFKEARKTFDRKSFSTLINVRNEEDVLSSELRFKIKELFPIRYGWVLHQFLTLQQILNSSCRGVLSIDSDTLILRPMALLNSDGVQVLMESLEYHKPYYDFLNRINPQYPIQGPTHVTHYSFFQKEILLNLFKEIDVESLEDFFFYVERFADLESLSPFCIDREFYAIGMRKYFPSRFTLVKFANVGVLRSGIQHEEDIKNLSRKYNSVSSHSYLMNEDD